MLTIYVVGHMEGLGSRRLEPGNVSIVGRVRFEFSKVVSQVFRLMGSLSLAWLSLRTNVSLVESLGIT